MRLLSANKPRSVAPSLPLCRRLNQHCCILQNSTAGGERPKRGVQELFNLLWGWRGAISMIQLSYLALWYASCKYILTLSSSLLHPLSLFSTLLLSWRSMSRWLLFLQHSPHVNTRWPHSSSAAETHTHTQWEVGRWAADNLQLQG